MLGVTLGFTLALPGHAQSAPDKSAAPAPDVIIFTNGCAPVPPHPKNRRTRVLWLFTSEETYRRQHAALRTIGRAGFLRDARA